MSGPGAMSSAADLLAPVDGLDDLGCRILATKIALHHPELIGELLEGIPIENGGRWDRAAYLAHQAADVPPIVDKQLANGK